MSRLSIAAVCFLSFGLALFTLAGCASSKTGPNSYAANKHEPTTAESQAALSAQIPFIEQSWVELGPHSRWIVRAATAQPSCPEVDLDGHRLPLLERTTTYERGQPILICEGDISPSQKYVTVMGHRHEIDLKKIKLIVVIGDTGCRVKAHGDRFDIQDCHSAEAWPFARMLNEVILPMHPDLIVHVGDYHYRESPCPKGNTDCDGAVAGDNVESWQQDFFTPAANALNQANWLFVRGNHEVCKRAGPSWFRFLDAHSYVATCEDRDADSTQPLSSTIGGVTLSWIDAADDHNIQPSLERLSEVLKTKSFLFMHRPFLIEGEDDEASTVNHLPRKLEHSHKITAVIVGHKHKFRLNKFSDNRPTEIISGNGGTKLLAPEAGVSLQDGWSSGQDHGVEHSTYWRHGFMTLEQQSSMHAADSKKSAKPDGWIAVEHDVTGHPIFTTHLN